MWKTPTHSHPWGTVITTTLRLCPACTRRDPAAEIVDPDCPICDGTGTLTLAEAGLNFYPARIIGETILLALEAKARIDDETRTLSDDRLQGIREALETLRDAGLLDNDAPLPDILTEARNHPDPAPLLAAALLQETIPGMDRLLSAGTRYEYQPDERPGQRGLPVVSRHGHPSSLARVTDPADPRADTRRGYYQRQRDHRTARVLHHAAAQAAPKRRRRARQLGAQDGPDLFEQAGITVQ